MLQGPGCKRDKEEGLMQGQGKVFELAQDTGASSVSYRHDFLVL